MNLRERIEELEKRLALLEASHQEHEDIDMKIPPILNFTDPLENNKTTPPFEWPDMD